MSQMDYVKAKLIPIEMNEEIAQKILKESESKAEASEGYSWQECLCDELCDKYTKINNRYYKVEDFEKNDYPPDLLTFNKNEDGSVEFSAYYYNGSCHWSELIENKI
jgi:hypothetical protein